MAHRRRDLFPFPLLFLLAISSFFFVFVFFLSDFASKFRTVNEHLSFPAVVGSLKSTVSYLSNPSKDLSGSDLFSGQSRSFILSRLFSKEPKARIEASSSAESRIIQSSSSRVKEEIASLNFIAFKLHRRKMIDGVIQTHLVSSIDGYSATIHNLQVPAIQCLSPPRRLSHLTAAIGEEKLGHPLLGLLSFGPCSFQLRPTSLVFRPLAPHRPRFVQSFKPTLPFVYLSLHKSSISRGLFSRFALGWIQGLVGFYRMVGKLVCEVCLLKTTSGLEDKFEVCYIVDPCLEYKCMVSTGYSLDQPCYLTCLLLQLTSPSLARAELIYLNHKGIVSSPSCKERGLFPPSSLFRERSFPPSSLFRERSFPPSSLFRERSFPKKSFNFLTASLSCVMVYTGPGDATELFRMSPEVLKSSKSHYAVKAVTNPQLVIVLGWSLGCLMNFEPSNILADTLSNFYKFVYLSSCAFSLFALDLAFWRAIRVMSGIVYLCVTF